MVLILALLVFLFVPCVVGVLIVEHVYKGAVGNSSQKSSAGCISLLALSFLGIFLLHGLYSIGDSMPHRRRVSPYDVYGTYRIDRKFFSGKNADWQYEHYKFTITPDNKFLLTEIDDAGVSHQYAGKVSWFGTHTRRALWSAKLNEKHHLRVDSPTLIRSYFTFYYVIYSEKYGNMYFRREIDYPIYEAALSVIAIGGIWHFRYRKRRATVLIPQEP